MWVIKGSKKYIGWDRTMHPTMSVKGKAARFKSRESAENMIENLPTFIKKQQNWVAVEITEPETNAIPSWDKICNKPKENTFENVLDEFNVRKFLNEAIPAISNLRLYYEQQEKKEAEYNDEILDIRHYLRDKKDKLNAVQMQRVGYFLQSIEKEREICKKSRIVAGLIIKDIHKLANKETLKDVENIFTKPYKPRALSYEILDSIANTHRGKKSDEKTA